MIASAPRRSPPRGGLFRSVAPDRRHVDLVATLRRIVDTSISCEVALVIHDDLGEALALLSEHADVVASRPSDASAPTWAVRRGWDESLLALDDDALALAETDPAGVLARHAHPSLSDAMGRAQRLITRYASQRMASGARDEPHVKARKRAQLEILVEAARERFDDVPRFVDYGAGHGHLTRALLHALEAEAIGIDWTAESVARARELAGDRGPTFVHADASTESRLLRGGELLVGLHPCGALGDAIVEHAITHRAHVMMVSCCFQKVPGDTRVFLSKAAKGFAVPQHALGLANLAPESFDGSGDAVDKRRRRRDRMALRFALEARGVLLEPGAEARGVNKDRVRHGLDDIATLAFAARRLWPASPEELADATAKADRVHASVARFSLPRSALGRVLEIAIVLDRAQRLEEAGHQVEVTPLFSPRISPRNLGLFARAR